MTVPTEMIDALAKQYDFEQWSTPEPRDTNVAVWHFDIRNAGLGAWQVYRAHTVAQTPPPRALRGLGATKDVIVTDAVLLQPEKEERVLRFALFECASRSEGRAQLLRVLSELETMVMERSDAAGEVAFAMPGGTAILFVRGNIVAAFRNGGAKVSDLAPVARDFDKTLTKAPRGIKENAPVKTRAGRAVPLEITAAADTTYLFQARNGEVEIADGRPRFRPSGAGEGAVVTSAIREGKALEASSVAFRVE